MRDQRTTTIAEPIDLEQQAWRVKLSKWLLFGMLVQAGAVAALAWRGAADLRVAGAFLAAGGGVALLFLVLYKLGANLHGRRQEWLLPQCLCLALVQLGFVVLAPKLALLFLLGALAAFACGMNYLSVARFWLAWAVYAAASAAVLWWIAPSLRGMLPAVGLRTVWLFFALGLGLFALVREQVGRLQAQLAAKSQQLHAALAKIDGLGKHDPLTGVLNRHTLIETLESELLRSRRTGHPFCFVVVDLDHFRTINDKYGSDTGDRVLKALADCAVRLLRALDRFGRIGGEQFGIVLPATWLDQGMIAMTRLTNAVEAIDWQDIADDMQLTFSAGITTNATNDTVEAIIKRAETALAQAKSEGRNRIVQIEESLPEMAAMAAE